MPEQPAKARPLLALVALKTSSLPPPHALLANLKTVPGIAVDLGSLKVQGTTFAFGLGNDQAAVALMPVAIPWSDLEGPCATAWWWPEATERMKGHANHVLAALVGDTGNLIQRHITLTHLTALIASHTEALGVYWGGGRLVHDPQVFVEQAQNISPERLPLHLWIDFRVEPNDDGTYRLYTTGMGALGLMEIEIPRSRKPPAEVYDFAYAIANYLLTSRPDIKDGHTVGRSDEEQIRASRAPSMWDPATTVLQLDF